MEAEENVSANALRSLSTSDLLRRLVQLAPRDGASANPDFVQVLAFLHPRLPTMNETEKEELFRYSLAFLNSPVEYPSRQKYAVILPYYLRDNGMAGLDLQRVYENLADVPPDLLVLIGDRFGVDAGRRRVYTFLLRNAARFTDSRLLWTALRDLGHRPYNALERRGLTPLGVTNRFTDDPVEGGVLPGFAFSAAVQEGDFEEANAIARANPNISTRRFADEAEMALWQMHGQRHPPPEHRGRYEATGRLLRARGFPEDALLRKFEYDANTDNTVSSRRTLMRTAVASRIAADSNARVLPPNASEEQKVINLLARLPEEIRRRIISYLVVPQDVMVLADPTRFYPRLQHTPEDLFKPGRNVREFCYHLQGEDQYDVRLLHMVMFPHIVVPEDMHVVCDNIARALRL